MKRIVLSGGGSIEKEALVVAHFASLVPRGGRVLNLPWAQLDPTQPGLHQWIQSALGPFGVTDIVTAQIVNGDVVSRIESFDAVFMGGGNTYRLLQRLLEPGLYTTHLLACLRIADVVTFTVARLATDVGGLALRRAGIAPAGQHSKFHGVIASSNPPRPALPGRTVSRSR